MVIVISVFTALRRVDILVVLSLHEALCFVCVLFVFFFKQKTAYEI